MKLCHSEVTSSTLEMYVYHTYKHYIQKLLLRELQNLDNLIFPCTLIKNKGSFIKGESYCETVNALKLEILSTPNCLVVRKPLRISQFRE